MAREYKDSGIEWIGRIPREWKVGSIKHYCISIFAGGTPQSNKLEFWDGDIPWIPSGSCKNDVIVSAPKYITQLGFENSSTKLIPSGTTVMAMTGATCSNVGYVLFDTCMNQSVVAYLNKRGTTCSKFLFYLLRGAQEEILTHKTGGAQSGINVDDCKNIIVPFISLSDQQKIADYLDEKCGEIDSLISLQEQMIAQLTDYKQSVITEAVTKGLDPNAQLVPSGIDWIGDIPKGWKVARIKNVASLYGRIGFRGYTSDDLNKDGVGAITLSPSNMLSMKMDYTNVTYLSWEKYYESPEIMIQNGDLLMVKTGSSYGKVSYVDNLPREATINPQILRIISKIESKYLGYYLQTQLFLYQVEGGVVGGTIPTIAQEKINNFKVVLPSLDEQRTIADYLDNKCAEIDALIALKQQKIETLKDYKKSLIYECVTGKKEV